MLVIAPWNFPLDLALSPVVGILAAGNVCVVKPSEVSTHCEALLAKLLPRYLPSDAVRVVTGGPSVSAALLEQRWDHIMYTGNGSIGRLVMAAAAEHLTPLTLELGGKCPVIVDETAKIGLTARRIAQGKWLSNAGQICISPDFVLVHEAVERPLLHALEHEAKAMLGDDKDAWLGVSAPPGRCAYGRIINERHVHRIAALLDDCGGTTLIGRTDQIDAQARFVPPLIVSRPDADADILTEEIFGPVLPVVPVASVDEAIERVRRICEHPLALYVFSESRTGVEHVLSSINSGGASVNSTLEHATNPLTPFGGAGESGFGAYHGKAGFHEFSHRRSLLYRTTRLPLTMLPGVIQKGLVPPWLYGLVIKIKVSGFLSPRLQLLLRLVATALAVLGARLGTRAVVRTLTLHASGNPGKGV